MNNSRSQRSTALDIDELCAVLETGGNWAKHNHYRAVHHASLLGVRAPSREQYEQAQVNLRNRLRIYVDEWLDTGFRSESDGKKEYPSRRSLSPLRVAELEPTLTVHTTPLLKRTGIIKLAFAVHGFGESLEDRNPEVHARRDAQQYFLRFLQSKWPLRFAKCRRCQQYFVSDRNLHPVYKRGIHCPQCRSKITAIASQDESRRAFREIWISLAAKAWNAWMVKDGDRIVFVTGEVNKRIRPKKIARNSVSLHRAEIEQLAHETASQRKGT